MLTHIHTHQSVVIFALAKNKTKQKKITFILDNYTTSLSPKPVFGASSRCAFYIMRHQVRVEVVIDGQNNSASYFPARKCFTVFWGRDHDLLLKLHNNQTEVQPEVM